jgi:flagellin-like protein
MGIGGSSVNRKGMSPLIATVLLMAFAVALGGMIMNWSIDTATSGDCESVKVTVTKLCIVDSGTVTLNMRNDKEGATIEQIQLKFTQDGFESTLRIKDSQIAANQPLDSIIPISIQPGTQVQLLAVVGTEPNVMTCSEPVHTTAAIQSC